ncbi:hypothetical protein [Devosia sp. 2618]|uniref:hypothetical protein n=1 Tax=Devosia sp. 2618 TaxID=3156454 RepID=UPI00339AB1CE
MPFRSRGIAKEMGTAFAVLAIYVFTLLAPLHHAAAQQRDFATLGYETLTSWSICANLTQNDFGDQTVTASKCAAAGIAKNDFVATAPASIDLPIIRIVERVAYFTPSVRPPQTVEAHIGQARAPPVMV